MDSGRLGCGRPGLRVARIAGERLHQAAWSAGGRPTGGVGARADWEHGRLGPRADWEHGRLGARQSGVWVAWSAGGMESGWLGVRRFGCGSLGLWVGVRTKRPGQRAAGPPMARIKGGLWCGRFGCGRLSCGLPGVRRLGVRRFGARVEILCLGAARHWVGSRARRIVQRGGFCARVFPGLVALSSGGILSSDDPAG